MPASEPFGDQEGRSEDSSGSQPHNVSRQNTYNLIYNCAGTYASISYYNIYICQSTYDILSVYIHKIRKAIAHADNGGLFFLRL